jgi:hypothetical protein
MKESYTCTPNQITQGPPLPDHLPALPLPTASWQADLSLPLFPLWSLLAHFESVKTQVTEADSLLITSSDQRASAFSHFSGRCLFSHQTKTTKSQGKEPELNCRRASFQFLSVGRTQCHARPFSSCLSSVCIVSFLYKFFLFISAVL